MNKNLLKLIVACGTACFLACAAPQKTETEKWSERMARSEMKRFPEPWMIEKAKKPRWGYTHGLVVKSMLEEWKHTGDSVYYEYAKIYADSLIDADGHIKTMKYLSFNIDNVNGGKILFDLYAQTGDKRYKIAMDTLRKQMAEQQILIINSKTYDPATGLYYHGWDESREQKWSNPETGCSPNFWSRSIGWYGAAIVDVLDFLPQETAGRDSIIQILQGLAKAIVKYQDPSSGTWYQVTDQGAREGNYLESSATALFIYTLAKAINKGYIGNEYIEPTQKAFDGMVKTFTRLEEDGSYTITNCCAVAGLGGDSKRYRDGSFEYYISEPIIENDPKSIGSFILAAIEYEKMTKK